MSLNKDVSLLSRIALGEAPSISVRNARLAYHDSLLFKDLSLDLAAKEWTCLLGPSGVGKTSLLRLIAGLASEAEAKISASDNIRVIASYAIAMLELAREFATNHPNLLILDEPRQQSLSKVSFREIFERLSRCANSNQQVIIATSEAKESLNELLRGIPAHVRSFPANILSLRNQ